MERSYEPKFFSVPEVSQILGLSVSRTYQLVRSAECPFGAIGIGKRIIIPANSLYSWYNRLEKMAIVEEEQQSESEETKGGEE